MMQLSFETSKRKAEALRERGEELYILAQRWLHGFSGRYLHLRTVMQGGITYNQYLELDLQGQRDLSEKFELGRMELLIEAYFPSVQPAYATVGTARDEIAKTQDDHKAQYKVGRLDGSSYIEKWDSNHRALELAGADFKKAILDAVREIK